MSSKKSPLGDLPPIPGSPEGGPSDLNSSQGSPGGRTSPLFPPKGSSSEMDESSQHTAQDQHDKALAIAEKTRKKAKKAMRKLAVIEATLSGDEVLAAERRIELEEAKFRLKMEIDRLK